MRRWIAVVMMLAGAAGTAEAQDAGRIGIPMGYPASIGVVWQLSDRVALRPELSVMQSTTDSTAVLTIGTPAGTTTSTSRTSSDSWTADAGASALFYVQPVGRAANVCQSALPLHAHLVDAERRRQLDRSHPLDPQRRRSDPVFLK